MDKIIVFKEPGHDGIFVIHPTGELTLEETAKKDVPTGVPYKILDVSDLPSDRVFRDAWDMDESLFIDGVGGQ